MSSGWCLPPGAANQSGCDWLAFSPCPSSSGNVWHAATRPAQFSQGALLASTGLRGGRLHWVLSFSLCLLHLAFDEQEFLRLYSTEYFFILCPSPSNSMSFVQCTCWENSIKNIFFYIAFSTTFSSLIANIRKNRERLSLLFYSFFLHWDSPSHQIPISETWNVIRNCAPCSIVDQKNYINIKKIHNSRVLSLN